MVRALKLEPGQPANDAQPQRVLANSSLSTVAKA